MLLDCVCWASLEAVSPSPRNYEMMFSYILVTICMVCSLMACEPCDNLYNNGSLDHFIDVSLTKYNQLTALHVTVNS